MAMARHPPCEQVVQQYRPIVPGHATRRTADVDFNRSAPILLAKPDLSFDNEKPGSRAAQAQPN
jgi:hypothetical protein